MKFTKLDARGVAHHFALALVVVGIITAFTFQAVAGHAQTLRSRLDIACTTTTTSTITLTYSYVGASETGVKLNRGLTTLTTGSGTKGTGTFTEKNLNTGADYTYKLSTGSSTKSVTCSTKAETAVNSGNGIGGDPDCAVGYKKDSAGNCNTTVVPTCPKDTTLKTSLNLVTKVTSYYCQDANEINISNGADGIAPPAAAEQLVAIPCTLIDTKGKVFIDKVTYNKKTCIEEQARLHINAKGKKLDYCFVDRKGTRQYHTAAYCAAIQKKVHINDHGLALELCPYTDEKGVSHNDYHSPAYCKSIVKATAGRLGAAMNKCQATRPTLSLKTAKSNYACTYYVQKKVAIPTTGNFDATTDKAVKAFQTNHKPLVVDGIVGKCTWPTLQSGKVPASCKPKTSAATEANDGDLGETPVVR